VILEVQHETRLEYTDEVTESVTELRMEPASDADQSCHSFHLSVSPAAEVFRYPDGFGNHAHHFNMLPPHRQVRILAAGVVVTHPSARDLPACGAAWPVNLDEAPFEVLDFLRFQGPVRPTPRLGPVLDALRPAAGLAQSAMVLGVAGYIRAHFEYAPHVTLASSPIDDVLEHGKGVCQDFTHLMIAVLRSFGVPARYVSGYVHRPNKESQSHAWCEVWWPELGWVGIDPTNNRLVDDRFVKVAVGRDFTDVPPNKGVYRGKAHETISVRVETRELDRLPSLSWQEQLPPLNAPLTALPPRMHGDYVVEDDQQQQ
jgi:transglutaminase-like putative cysteine protease